MNRETVKCDATQLQDVLLPRLKGAVFHVTSKRNWAEIRKRGRIKHNREERFRFSFPQSENSYGRKRGYVCLFDLRHANDEQIQEALYKYYFLNPTVENDPVYLIVSESVYAQLIPWEAAMAEVEYNEAYVPYVECWYPGDISLDAIRTAVEVEVTVDAEREVARFYRELSRRSRKAP